MNLAGCVVEPVGDEGNREIESAVFLENPLEMGQQRFERNVGIPAAVPVNDLHPAVFVTELQRGNE